MEKKHIFMGADSAGYALKEVLRKKLIEAGYETTDCGTDSPASCHYPLFASAVCEKVLDAPDQSLGILICGTGIGMSMCANKYHGIRAAACENTYSARMTRCHNDANVLCMGARVIGECLAEDIMWAFLHAEFEGGRHAIRLGMMKEIEEKG